MINQFKDQYCLSGSSQALLGSIISGCGLSQDPEELFFELKETLFGGVANMPQCAKDVIVADRLNSLNSGGPDDITVGELMSIFGEENIFSCDMGIEEANISPINPPITPTYRVCPEIFDFKIEDNIIPPHNGTTPPVWKKAGSVINSVYFQFTVPGQQPLTVSFYHFTFIAFAGGWDATCLSTSAQSAANALNYASQNVQNLINNPTENLPRALVLAKIKDFIAIRVNREFSRQVGLLCGDANYTGTVDVSAGDFNDFPTNNCDALIGNCPQ